MTPIEIAASPVRRQTFSGKRIVVTGGAGFLGRYVVEKLKERGCRDIMVPRRAAFDLSRWDDIERVFEQSRPHYLLHLAATVDSTVGHRNVATSFYNNVLMTTQLMEAASRHGVEKMICIGSASSYPPNAPFPLREQDLFKGLPDASREAHGTAKRLAWVQAKAYRQQYGFQSVFLIPTNFYGPGDNFDPKSSYVIPSLIRKFIEAAESGADHVIIGGTGCATRDFLHVEDVADAIVAALERYSGAEAINIGSGVELGIHELARKIARVTGFTGRIQWDPTYPDGPTRRVLDISRAQKELGFKPKKNLNDGLQETVEWYRSARAGAAFTTAEIKVLAKSI